MKCRVVLQSDLIVVSDNELPAEIVIDDIVYCALVIWKFAGISAENQMTLVL